MIYQRRTEAEIEALPHVQSAGQDQFFDFLRIYWSPILPGRDEEVDQFRELPGATEGSAYQVPGAMQATLPDRVDADCLWHLCSIVGLKAAIAFTLYKEVPS